MAAQRPATPTSHSLLGFCIACKLVLYFFSARGYGYMSDELYFLDATRHLALGYVDFPPLIVWLTAGLTAVAGESLWALRALPAVTGLLATLVAVDLCRLAGGQALARWLTALTVLFAPGFVSVQSILTMNALDQLWWLAACWLLLAYLRSGAPGHMLGIGLVLGCGALTKLSIVALCIAVPLGLLLFAPRTLRRREFWLAALICLAFATPYLAWQFANGWPVLDFIAAYNREPPESLVLQNPVLGLVLTMNPVYALFWIPGIIYSLTGADRPLRALGTVVIACLALYWLAGVKFYFAVPAIGVMLICGAVFWERLCSGVVGRALLVGAAASGALALPMAAPMLPALELTRLADFLRDSEAGLDLDGPVSLGRYFPHFAEMHGWPELVGETRAAFEALPAPKRARSILVAAHYGQAAALNRLDAGDRLPAAHSGHMSYHLWNAGVVFDQGLFIGFEAAELESMYAQVRRVGNLDCSLCMSRERGLGIYHVERPRLGNTEIRARLRRFYFF